MALKLIRDTFVVETSDAFCLVMTPSTIVSIGVVAHIDVGGLETQLELIILLRLDDETDSTTLM